jgi:Transketolase, C-terminal domain
MATGTEVGLAIDAYEKLAAEGVKARVVSMPSWELFEQQPESYRDSVLPHDVKAPYRAREHPLVLRRIASARRCRSHRIFRQAVCASNATECPVA